MNVAPMQMVEDSNSSRTAGPPGLRRVSGDCQFPGGVGRIWRPGDLEQLLDDATSRLFNVYDDSRVIYPGPGDDTALGDERPHIQEWRECGWYRPWF